MLAIELAKDDVKNFMGRLLREEIFDGMEMRTTEIAAIMKITIDGEKLPDEKPADAKKGGFARWSEARPLIFEIIKQCAKPRMMKIVFSKTPPEEIHKNAAALFLNLIYENDTVSFTTATAQKEFALNKELDDAWDTWVREFFAKNNIAVSDRV